MKYILYLLVSLGALFSSCNKYLDKEPDNRTDINTIEKVSQLVTSAYPGYDYLYFTEAASDNSEDKGAGQGSLENVVVTYYNWEDVIGDETGSATQYWNGCYEAIAAANQALASIEEHDFGNEVLPYKGEALVARAYAHFMLVTFFSKAYQIGGANDSPGIPYVTEPETKVIQPYDRSTVAATYEKIEADLEEGLPLLSSSAYSVPKYHFTPVAAHAFASRFYLFKGEWQKVVDHATASVPGGDFLNNLRPTNTSLRDMTGEEFRQAFTRSDLKANLLLANVYSGYQRLSSPRYGYGEELVLMFNRTHNFTGKSTAHQIIWYGSPHYTTYKYKEYFYRVSPNASTGFPYMMQPLLTVDETLMNRAEAFAELGQFDQALGDINTFYSTKISDYNANTDKATVARLQDFYSIDNPKGAIIETILASKKFEFLQEGVRWLDLVRRNIPVKHNHYATNGVESFEELAPDDNRRVFQIPQEAKLSGVAENPR